jgi:succinate dehydrogenase/fumarate reductase flavoprotein subunit
VSTGDQYDVIVVGGGGAGLAAAIEARKLGREVLLLEKNPALGGSTAWSIGSITSSATPHQIARGIKDCPADHWADMPAFAGDLASRDNDELRRILCEEIPDAFRWLIERGVRFYGPVAEPPHHKPRMHTVLPNSGSYIYHLQRHARRLGVEILTNVRARELVRASGRVCGVRCEGQGEKREFRARGAVVLAAGDFTNSPELKGRFMGPQEAKIEGVNLTATGDGQLMAEKLGARILNGDLALGPEIRFIAPARDTLVRLLPPWPALAVFMQWALEHLPQAILRPFLMSFLTTALAPSPAIFQSGAVLVNKQGRRFCDERDRPAYALPDQLDQLAYILIDARIATLFSAWPNYVSTAPGVAYAYIPDYRRSRPDIYTAADTLDQLARKLGVDAAVLGGTVRAYNDSVQSDKDAGDGSLHSLPLVQEPFTALGPVRAVFVHNEGGLKVDVEHRVLDQDAKPIPGLYAAGSTGQGGLLLKGHGHHLAWAFVSGRRAGRFAAYNAVSENLH